MHNQVLKKNGEKKRLVSCSLEPEQVDFAFFGDCNGKDTSGLGETTFPPSSSFCFVYICNK